MSPEAMNRVERSDLRLIVESFYDALRARDGQLVAEIVEEHFAPDATLRRPESLPGGGVTAGAEKIKRFMVAAATMDGPLDISKLVVHQILEHAGDDGEHVVVDVRFPIPGGGSVNALEWWSLRDLKVAELRAYYWDTAAMVGGSRAS